MQPKRPIWFLMVVVVLTLSLMIGGVDVMARGGGGGGGGGAGGGGGPGGGPGGGHSVGVRGGPPGSFRMQRVYDGPAGGGSFASRPAPQPQATPTYRTHTSPDTRTRARTEVQESPSVQQPAVPAQDGQTATVQEVRSEQQKPGEYGKDNYWDQWHYRRHRVALGTVYTENEFREMRCQSPTVVDGVNYYNCEGVWHRRAYSGGRVIYMVVEAPRSQ